MSKGIPKSTDDSSWKKVKIDENSEELMSVEILGLKQLIVTPYFIKKGYKNDTFDVLVREQVCEKLMEATFYLPSGYKIVLVDGWRSKELQQKIFEDEKNKLWKENEKLTEEEIESMVNEYIEYSVYERKPSVETTGGSISVLILNEKDEELNMGTYIFEYDEKSITTYFEKKKNVKEIKENRKLLVEIMTSAGFINNKFWWKFDFGTQYWAKLNNTKAIYGKKEIKK